MLHASVDLPWTRNLLLRILDHLIPLRQPTGGPRNREQHGKHIRLEAHSLINDSRVEVHIRIELASDEVLVRERNSLQLECDVESLVASCDLEHFVGNGLDDGGARVVILVHPVPKAHELELTLL